MNQSINHDQWRSTVALSVAGVALLTAVSAVLVALISPSVSPAPAGAEAVPSPLDVEEFSRQGCQLEQDTDGTVSVYCKRN